MKNNAIASLAALVAIGVTFVAGSACAQSTRPQAAPVPHLASESPFPVTMPVAHPALGMPKKPQLPSETIAPAVPATLVALSTCKGTAPAHAPKPPQLPSEAALPTTTAPKN